MARRSKKQTKSKGNNCGSVGSNKRNNDVNANNKNRNISELIDSRRKVVEQNKIKKGVPQVQKDAKLIEKYSDILKKFQIPKNTKKKDAPPNNSNVVVYSDNNKNTENENDMSLNEIEDDTPKISKRKLRKLAKPTLIDLKSYVTHPEVIEWYDCDAKYPFLLASIKSTKNIVPVPSHWQSKREYLSGRSLLEKRPFELPDIIKQTDIEQMRTTLQTQDDTESSLKEQSRSKIQPKLGALDIDFNKLYDIFFKIGSTWKPDILLPFGDLYYENRHLFDESQWTKIQRERKPGKISKELRDIMGLSSGQLPPWCMKFSKIGLPPSYPDFKIAGFNWDIKNLNNEYYGKLPNNNIHTINSKKMQSTLFGKILNFENDTKYEEDYNEKGDEKEESENEKEAVIDSKENNSNDDNYTKITEVEIVSEETKGNYDIKDEGKRLYTVLEETTSIANVNTVGSKRLYSLRGSNVNKDSASKDVTVEENTSENDGMMEEQERNELKKFKF